MAPITPASGQRPGRHKARHKAPGPFERARLRVGASVRSVPRPAAAVSVAGLLAASAVAGGTALGGDADPVSAPATSMPSDSPSVTLTYERGGTSVTRSVERPSLEELKTQALDDVRRSKASPAGRTVVSREELAGADADPQDIALAMLPQYGWSESEFGCLVELWTRESAWDPYADNPTSSAYGIPQSLPGEKMASAGADWATNPATQIEWGLGYIQDVYGSPCAADSFQLSNNWY